MIWFNNFDVHFLILLLVLIIITLTVINYKKTNLFNKHTILDKNIENLLNHINFHSSFESNLTELLSIVSSSISVSSYALYVYEDKNSTYILKAIRQAANENAEISPAYSGLLPYKKETFFMPSVLSIDNLPDRVEIIKYGEVPLIIMPFKNKRSLIALGPVKKLSSKDRTILQIVENKLNPMIMALIETDALKNKMKLMLSSKRAVKNVSSLFTDMNSMLNVILEVTIKSVNASGALFISKQDDKHTLEEAIGLEDITESHLAADSKTHFLLFELLGDNDYVFLNKRKRDYFRIPPYLVAENIETLLLVKVDSTKGSGIAVFWYNEDITIRDYQIAALKVFSQRIADIINNYVCFRKISSSYVDILKSLAKLIDNLSRHTVGYSELMYRYAIIICRELKLSNEETTDIALAAYLSNIGVIGLSDKLLTKSGRYDDLEYEMMKLHSDCGASIIEATIGNPNIASYIRYHHERMDGFGYPEQLKGEEIPLGARIIGVIQAYLAKILSRDYRKAIPFGDAILQLKKASGAQLDTVVVDALINWFQRKQQQNKSNNSSLGRCWEMRCVPENICIKCSAYKKDTKNCWDTKGVNCSEHGNECDSCFIYTEYKSRMNLK
jgi:HD-GYP domain-containing protein (c-di-GMP phosphodiesterase class II)